jgi:ADP-ribose pyrophosphatase YjhB (NUDIX family)
MFMTSSPPVLDADPRAYPAYPLLAASIAVFREGKALIATRTKPPGAGVWSLPGGLVEVGEPLEQAALRELLEEVGVEARIVGFNRHVQRIDRDDDGRIRSHFVVASYVGVWTAGEATVGPEAGEVRWVDPHDLEGLPTTPHLSRILARAAKICAEVS